MSQRDIERALKKQRLLMDSAVLREQMAVYGRGVEPVFTVVDVSRQAWAWLKARPAIPVAMAVAVFVARPRFVVRWARRAWLGWKAVERWRALAVSVDRVRER